MTLEGTVVQGTIVLDQPGTLPEGARVTVTVQGNQEPAETLSELLTRYAGCMHRANASNCTPIIAKPLIETSVQSYHSPDVCPFSGGTHGCYYSCGIDP